MMTTDQAVRLQCLELAVKAGTPWNMLTITADKLTAYVRGVKIMPSVEVKNTSTFGAIAGVEGDVQASWDKVIAKQQEAQQAQELAKGLAVEEEPTLRINLRTCPGCGASDGQLHANDCTRNRDITSWKPDPTAGSMTVEPDRGVAIEEDQPNWPPSMTDEEVARAEALISKLDYGKSATQANALHATLPEDQRGTPVEETYDGMTGQADYPVTSPYAEQPKIEPAGAANDPRLPVVTM